jgi:hypothetical protein
LRKTGCGRSRLTIISNHFHFALKRPQSGCWSWQRGTRRQAVPARVPCHWNCLVAPGDEELARITLRIDTAN